MKPVCHVVAGPNGAGKSTFALDYLPEFAGSIEYVNPDLMASGLSPLDIRLSAMKSGRLALKRIAALFDATENPQRMIYSRNGGERMKDASRAAALADDLVWIARGRKGIETDKRDERGARPLVSQASRVAPVKKRSSK